MIRVQRLGSEAATWRNRRRANPLTGEALLQKVKTLATLSKTQKAKACGLLHGHEGGGERVNLLQFLQALLEAEGIAAGQTSC
jgi:hypothetical protein